MPNLTPGEYDDLPQSVKDELAGVVRQPKADKKNISFRKRFGRRRNGELDASPDTAQPSGYGTGTTRYRPPGPWLSQ